MKWLMWLALGLLVYLALRSRIAYHRSKRDAASSHDNSGSFKRANRSSATVENMVACAYCQMYLPVSEAVFETTSTENSSDSHYFCSKEHARLFLQTASSDKE